MAKKIKSLKKRFKQNKYIYAAQILLTLVILVDYTFTRNIDHSLGGWFYILPVAGLTLGLLPLFRGWNFFRHKYLVLLIGYFVAGLFLVFLTDIFGPYFQVLILLLFSSIYWFGWFGLTFGLTLQALTLVIGAWYQFGALSDDLLYVLLIHFATLAVLGVLFERVSLRHRLRSRRTHELLQTVSFERTRLLSLINSMADAVMATDNQGRILLYNGATLDLLNTNVSLERKNIKQFINFKDESGKSVDVIAQARKSGKAMKRDDLSFVSNEGQEVNLYIDIAPIHSGQAMAQHGGFIMLLRDITKEKTLDEERSEFISVTSHELRTPIAIAEANLSTALLPNMSKGLQKSTKDLLKQAHNQVVFLGDLVNDLTTLARAERGDLDLEVQPLNPRQMLEKLAQDYSAEAKEKGIKVVLAAEVTDHQVKNSELYVHEVLQNFVTNALKYTEKGQLTLGASKKGPDLVFSVADTGIGISASDKRKIFDKFYRAEDYRTRKTRGTGLGLYITKKLADKVKGKIWFDSKLNKGSTFYFQVPSLHPKRTRRKR